MYNSKESAFDAIPHALIMDKIANAIHGTRAAQGTKQRTTAFRKFVRDFKLRDGAKVELSTRLSPGQRSAQRRAQPSTEHSPAQRSGQHKAQSCTASSSAQSSSQHRAQPSTELSPGRSAAQHRVQDSAEFTSA